MPTTHTFSLPADYRRHPRVAPWWLGYLFVHPLRRVVHDPARILRPHAKTGQAVLEVGPGMGFFTLPLARLIGDGGRIVAVDCQERMIAGLRRRADSRGLAGRIETRTCSGQSLCVTDLADAIDLVVAINVVHEAADPERMIGEMVRALRPGGRLLLSEPRGRVSRDLFLWEYGLVREAGLVATDWPRVAQQRTVVMAK